MLHISSLFYFLDCTIHVYLISKRSIVPSSNARWQCFNIAKYIFQHETKNMLNVKLGLMIFASLSGAYLHSLHTNVCVLLFLFSSSLQLGVLFNSSWHCRGYVCLSSFPFFLSCLGTRGFLLLARSFTFLFSSIFFLF